MIAVYSQDNPTISSTAKPSFFVFKFALVLVSIWLASVDRAFSSEIRPTQNIRTNQPHRNGSDLSRAKYARDRLESFNFSCAQTEDKQGTLCRGKVSSYPAPIRIYIPKSYSTGAKRLAIHLHGNNLSSDPRDNSMHFSNGRADFNRWLEEAGSDQLLVVPESIGATLTYDAQFPSSSPELAASNFDKLIDSIEELAGSTIRSVSLSAHSGGYRAVAALGLAGSKRLQQIDAIGLFDAVYGRTSQIKKWVSKLQQRGGTAYVLYVENGTTMKSGPDDQRKLNSIFNDLGISPKAHQAGEPLSSFSLLTVKAAHMDVLKDQRFTDFLRSMKPAAQP